MNKYIPTYNEIKTWDQSLLNNYVYLNLGDRDFVPNSVGFLRIEGADFRIKFYQDEGWEIFGSVVLTIREAVEAEAALKAMTESKQGPSVN